MQHRLGLLIQALLMLAQVLHSASEAVDLTRLRWQVVHFAAAACRCWPQACTLPLGGS